jgi:glycolate oxidase
MQDRNSEQLAAQRLTAAGTDFQTLHEIVAKARQNLNQNDWDYIVGATETETTLRRNRLALDSLAFRPRVLRDVSHVDSHVAAFGQPLRLPVVLAPVGALESFHPGAAASVVRAAGEFGAAHMLSSVCEPGLETVAASAPDATRIFQLYVRGDVAWVDDHVARAVDCGCAAFFITVDTAIYSRRERDLAKRHVVAGRRRASGREFQAALDWRTIARIKSKFSIPLGLKGIATAEDARIALDHGVDWIYVSNHGGRQLDHGRGTMEVLPAGVDAVAGRAGGEGARRRRQSGRPRPPAMLCARGRRRERHRAHAGADRGRGAALPRLAWRDGVRRTRPVVPARRPAGDGAARVRRVSAAED